MVIVSTKLLDAMYHSLRVLRSAAFILMVTCSVKAAAPSLSVSFLPPASVQISWPSNFTSPNWQLAYATNLGNWQPVPLIPPPLGDAYVVVLPLDDPSGYFRLQQVGGAGGGCAFQATPAVITAGASSTLTWCPQAGTSYSISPGPGSVSGSSLSVSPSTTTVYSLTASNASEVLTGVATVIVNPCGWLQVKSWDAKLYFSYIDAGSTSDYNFSLRHTVGFVDDITFHLTLQAGSTATDASYFGFATSGKVAMKDREDDKTGPQVFTTTEVGSGSPVLNVSFMSLHVTCTSYDFSYSVVMNTTETSSFGVTTSFDGTATGGMAGRPLPAAIGVIRDEEYLPGEYPPSGGDYFSPDSDLGKAAFTTGVFPQASRLGSDAATVEWQFSPAP
jgi:hypothetical protein